MLNLDNIEVMLQNPLLPRIIGSITVHQVDESFRQRYDPVVLDAFVGIVYHHGLVELKRLQTYMLTYNIRHHRVSAFPEQLLSHEGMIAPVPDGVYLADIMKHCRSVHKAHIYGMPFCL